MYYVNKIALFVVNPINVGLMAFVWLVIHSLFSHLSRKTLIRLSLFLLGWFWFWGCGFAQNVMCWMFSLDKYPIVEVSAVENADVIVDLGGGMGSASNICSFAEMHGPADRAWHSARLWKAGKAPIIIPTGIDILNTDTTLLRDLGIPDDSICVENKSRNTEENARFTSQMIKDMQGPERQGKSRAIIVTSISHMRRAMMIFKTIAPEIDYIAVPCDYGEVHYLDDITYKHFFPSVGCLCKNMVVYKECLGILGYWIRGFRD